MKFLTLEDIKAQCRIEPDFTDEDNLLTSYGNAAESGLLRICRRTADNLIEEFGEDGNVPSDFRLACLMLTKHLYEHRGPTEGVTHSMIPYSIDFFIKPFMCLTTTDDTAANATNG